MDHPFQQWSTFHSNYGPARIVWKVHEKGNQKNEGSNNATHVHNEMGGALKSLECGWEGGESMKLLSAAGPSKTRGVSVYTHTHIHTCMYACIYTYVYTYIHIYVYIYTHSLFLGYTFIYTHIYIYMYTYTLICPHMFRLFLRWQK